MKKLTHKTEIRVRFNDADPLAIVWHGNYVQYMEDAREAFGEAYGFRYLDVHGEDYVIPLVNVNVDYKVPIRYGEKAIVEIDFIDSPAAKIIFDYRIYRSSDGLLAATGQTTQVFLHKETLELQLIIPEFYAKWKSKHLSEN